MGLFDFFKTKYVKTVPVGTSTDIGIAIMDSQFGNNQVNRPYANIPSVYKAVKAVIDNVSQANWVVKSGEEEVENTEIELLIDNAESDTGERLSVVDFLQTLVGNMMLFGECFILRKAETVGQQAGTQLPSVIVTISPANITEMAVNGVLGGWRIASGKYTGTYQAQDIIHIKDYNPYAGLRGISPVKVLMDELKIESSFSQHTWSLLENGAIPSMIITTTRQLTDEQRGKIKRDWEARHQGSRKAGKTAVMPEGFDAKTLSQSNADMQLVELMKMLDEKIIGMWRVPKAMFGYTDNLNRATFLGQLNVFWTMTIIPLLTKINEKLNKDIVTRFDSKYYLQFDYSNVEALQQTINDKMDTAIKLQTLGFTRNEINDKLELGFQDNNEWGDTWWIPFSQQPASMAFDTPEPVKSITKDFIEVNGLKYQEKQLSFIKNFNRLHDSIHRRFFSAVKGYYMGLRKRTLDAIDKDIKTYETKQVNINWGKEYDLFISAIEAYEQDAIEQGIKQGTTATGLTPSDRISLMASVATKQRLKFVADEVTQTNRKQIEKLIEQGIADGLGVDGVKDSIKQYFNKASNRSEVIARTEITAQLNAGLLLQYDDVGVEMKEWVTNIDGFERESHREINGEKVGVKEPFSNGLMMPAGLGDPEETINCRCSVFPVIGGK